MNKLKLYAAATITLAFAVVQPVVAFASECASHTAAFARSTAEMAHDMLFAGMGKLGMVLFMANATYQPESGKSPYSGDDGNCVVFTDSADILANLATTDKVNLVKIPAGTLVDEVEINNPDLDSGATLAVNIGFANVDGSAGPSATAVATAATTWQAAATTKYSLFPPVKLTSDAYLQAVPTAGGVGTGRVYAKVRGEALGAA